MATIPGVSDGELIRTTWGDAVADELNTQCIKVTGGTITGNLQAAQMFVSGVQDTSTPGALTRRDYVAGLITASAATKVTNTGDTMSGDLIVGSSPYTAAGTLLDSGGRNASLVDDQPTEPNWDLFRAGTSYAGGSPYLKFQAATGATLLGSITVASGSSVAFNTTSDPRLKTPPAQARQISDAADRARQLGAQAWQGQRLDPTTGQPEEQTWDFLSSHDVQDVAPYAVYGERDGVDGDGKPVYQEVDYPSLVPLLFAALSQALDRIAVLEAAA